MLGRNLLPLLEQRGHSVRALIRDNRLALSAGVETMQGDLLDANTAAILPQIMAGCDAAIHIATAIPRDFAAPGAWDTNTRLRTDGTRRLLAATLAAGVRRYIQQSIVMAYADGGDNWLDENTPFDPSPAHAGTVAPVREMEAMVREAASDKLACCILRGGQFVGPGTMQDDLVARLRAGQVVIAGNGSNFISPIHVADMATAVVAALERAPAGSIFNIVDKPLRNGEYMDGLADRLGVAHSPRNLALPLPPSYRCTNQAAGETLGWTPTHSIWPAGEDVNSRDV